MFDLPIRSRLWWAGLRPLIVFSGPLTPESSGPTSPRVCPVLTFPLSFLPTKHMDGSSHSPAYHGAWLRQAMQDDPGRFVRYRLRLMRRIIRGSLRSSFLI